MKKIILIFILLSTVAFTGYKLIEHYEHQQNYPGVYSFEDLKTGEIVKFKIGYFPHGWSSKYKLLGSHYRRELLEMEKPKDLPEFVKWSTYNRTAYFDGRIHFNEDSTMALIVGTRPLHSEKDKQMVISALRNAEYTIGRPEKK